MSGPRWLAPVLLLLAALLAAWVLLLVFFDPKFGAADVAPADIRIAGAGIDGVAAVATALAARSLWQHVTAGVSVLAAATLLAVSASVHLALVPPAPPPLMAASPLGIALCGAAVWLTASNPAERRRRARVGLITGFMVASLVLAANGAVTLTESAARVFDVNTVLFWSLLDFGELVTLIGTGWGIWSRRPRLVVMAGTAGATMFLADAWLSAVLGVGPDLMTKAILFDVVGALPVAALCAYAVCLGLQHTAMSGAQIGR